MTDTDTPDFEPEESPVAETAPGAEPGAVAESDSEAEVPEAEAAEPDLAEQLAERTADLQRLQAEFLNYKRRVERDRELVRENALFEVFTPLIDVLDSIDRAREHGELDDGFRSVAEQLDRVVESLGFTKYGAPGEPFDPNFHEALSHVGTSSEVDVTTCQHLVRSGYRVGDRVLRTAQVLVVDPETPAEEPPTAADQPTAESAGPDGPGTEGAQ